MLRLLLQGSPRILAQEPASLPVRLFNRRSVPRIMFARPPPARHFPGVPPCYIYVCLSPVCSRLLLPALHCAQRLS